MNGQHQTATASTPMVLFIDMWPETREDGYWQDRFAAIPPAAAAAGFTAVVQHHRLVDGARWTAMPPAGIILSGSRYNLHHDPSIDPANGVGIETFTPVGTLLQQLPEVPVLGICFGHQYLAFAGGGILDSLPADRDDPAWAITIDRPDPLLAGLAAPRCVESHRWRVAEAPTDYTVFATSADGIEGMRHRTLPRVGVQFHPEYWIRRGATTDGRQILANWFASLG